MVRFVNDQNKVVLFHESGTYANASGNAVWIGLVESNSIDDSEGKMETRYVGALTRSWSQYIPGPRDVKGTLSYSPQDMRIPLWAIGSVVDTSGTNSSHLATQIQNAVRQNAFTSGTLNPPLSFTIEDSKTAAGANNTFIRTVNGCVPDVVRIVAAQNEKVMVEVDYIGQTLSFTSGTASSVTESTVTPYLWNNCSLTISGTSIVTAKNVDVEFNQNTEAPHYLNGSRDVSVPFFKNRDNILTVKLDLDAPTSSLLYNQLYKGNSQFDAVFDMNADSTTGSAHTIITFSGARIVSMDAPSELEGTTESTVEISAPIVVGSVFDRVSKYNPW